MLSKPMYAAGRALGLAPFGRDFTRPGSATWAYSVVIASLTLAGSGRFLTQFVVQFASAHGVPTPLFVSGVLLTIASSFAAVSNVLWAVARARTDFADFAKHLRGADHLLECADADNAAASLACAGVAVITINTYNLWFGSVSYELVLSRYLANSIIYYTVVHFVATLDALRVRYLLINEWLSSATHRQAALSVIRVRGLRKAHQLLSEAAHSADAHFGPRMLSVLLHILVSMGIYVYVIVSMTLRGQLGGSRTSQLHSAVTAAGWWIVNAVALVKVAMRAQQVADEARRAQVLVQERTCALDIGAGLRRELQQFARQLLTNQVSFSAFGVLRLDCTMLLSVAATVTSYTIILLSA